MLEAAAEWCDLDLDLLFSFDVVASTSSCFDLLFSTGHCVTIID